MEKGFIDILQKLIKEQGKEALTNSAKCKSLLRDYTKNEYQKETRFIIRAVEAGIAKTIDIASDLVNCKKILIKELQEDHGFAPEIAADIVNTFALVLRGDEKITVPEIQIINEKNNNKTENGISSSSYDIGVEYFNNKEYDKAITEFTEAIKQNPKNSQAYAYRARAYNNMQNYSMGMKDAEQAIEYDKKNAMGYFARGYVYQIKKEIDKAISDCNEAIQLDPFFVETYKLRADIYQNQDNFERAIEDFSQAIFLNPKDDEVYSWRGACYGAIGKNQQAIIDFTVAIQLNPNEGEHYYQRGMAYHNMRNIDLAIADYENAIRIGLPDYMLPYIKQSLEQAKRQRGW